LSNIITDAQNSFTGEISNERDKHYNCQWPQHILNGSWNIVSFRVRDYCGIKTLWRSVWSSATSTCHLWRTGSFSLQRTLRQEAVTQLQHSRVEALEHRRAVRKSWGSTSQQPQRLAMWQLLPRMQLNSALTNKPSDDKRSVASDGAVHAIDYC